MTEQTETPKAASPLGVIMARMKADECHWDNVADYIQIGMFGFCGCGRPEYNLQYIMNGLAHIDEEGPSDAARSAWHEWHKSWVKRGHEVLGNESSRYFFFYWADKEGLSEHGGSVPGWLTKEGKELLAALLALKAAGQLDD